MENCIVRKYAFTSYADFVEKSAWITGVHKVVELGFKQYYTDDEFQEHTGCGATYNVDIVWMSSPDPSLDNDMIWASTPDCCHCAEWMDEYETAYAAAMGV